MLPKYILLGSESLEEDVRKSIRLTDTDCIRPANSVLISILSKTDKSVTEEISIKHIPSTNQQ